MGGRQDVYNVCNFLLINYLTAKTSDVDASHDVNGLPDVDASHDVNGLPDVDGSHEFANLFTYVDHSSEIFTGWFTFEFSDVVILVTGHWRHLLITLWEDDWHHVFTTLWEDEDS